MEVWIGEMNFEEAHFGPNKAELFQLEIEFNRGKFTGVSVDNEFLKISDLPIQVAGFIEGDHISFIKSYPFHYEADEGGVTKIDTTRAGHNVIYDGYFDPIIEKWSGEWEIQIDEINPIDSDYKQIYIGGEWELNIPFDSYNEHD